MMNNVGKKEKMVDGNGKDCIWGEREDWQVVATMGKEEEDGRESVTKHDNNTN